MADLSRQYDWASTSLGPISLWEDALLIAVNLILSSRHPMFLFWGEDLIQFYNDGYRDTLDDEQHPLALGNRGREFWDNIWHIIGPQIDCVMNRGEAILVEDVYFPGRRTGIHENSYWTYSYTPLRNAHGVIRGTFVVCTTPPIKFWRATWSMKKRDASPTSSNRLPPSSPFYEGRNISSR